MAEATCAGLTVVCGPAGAADDLEARLDRSGVAMASLVLVVRPAGCALTGKIDQMLSRSFSRGEPVGGLLIVRYAEAQGASDMAVSADHAHIFPGDGHEIGVAKSWSQVGHLSSLTRRQLAVTCSGEPSSLTAARSGHTSAFGACPPSSG